ncbi:MAG: hypothetical protein OFPI_12750 [Osedax symbiont Rs2]|nr:MAG: hypothetical protein OFPI_12750 [Osedax symbiont Rs2]
MQPTLSNAINLQQHRHCCSTVFEQTELIAAFMIIDLAFYASLRR